MPAARNPHASTFARGPGYGLLQLGAAEVDTALPLAFAYWREFAASYVAAVCGRPDIESGGQVGMPPPPLAKT